MNTANLRLRDRWLLALFASLFLTVGASAQNEVEIQGRVTADGQPLVGASVIIKGTTTGTSTDIAGNFTVRAKNGAVLSVGFVGYKTREVAVTAGVTFLDIVLEAEEALIDDVVVIGYGSMKKSDLTGSVVSVKMDAIKDISAPSIEGLLQGRAAGLQIMNTSQDPGAGAVVRIRGNSSLNGSNTPLIVVDGFPIGDAGNLSQINPSDIESIEILKDASSSAIYGSRGANGVILIQTRTAKGGSTQVSVNHRTTIGQFTDKLNVWRNPLQMAQMREVIRRAGQDSTVLLSSHLLSEVTNVCGRAIVLDEGVIRYDGTMDALLRGAASLRLMYRGDAPMMALIRELPGVTEVTEQDCREDGCHLLLIRHEMDADLRAQVSALCYENHCALLEETNGSDALEDAFLHVIARKDISRKEVE